MKARRSIPLICLSILLSGPAAAFFEKAGVTGLGARPLGMGGAFTAVSDEAAAVYWNPAGLGQLTRAELSGMGSAVHNGKVFDFFGSAVMPVMDESMLGFSWARKAFLDSPGKEKEDVFFLTFGSAMNESRVFFAGVNLKYLSASSSFGDVGGSGIGVDFGFLARWPLPKHGKELRLGLALSDLNTKITQKDKEVDGETVEGAVEDVPSAIRIGAAYRFDKWMTLSLDAEHLNDSSITNPSGTVVRAGVEGWFFDGTLGLRMGYVGFETMPGKYSAGTSYRAADWEIDYAYLGHPGDLGDNHRATFTLRFGRVLAAGLRPSVVQGIRAAGRDGEVELMWNPSAETTVGAYNIFVATSPGGEYKKVNTVGLPSARVIGLENGRTYYFTVTALTDYQPPLESERSLEVAATPLEPAMTPPELGAPAREGEITVTWRETPGQNIAGYNVYISSSAGAGHVKFNPKPVQSTSVTISQIGGMPIAAEERYYIFVRSVSRSQPPVEGPPSAERTFIAVPRP